jgi:hypothetical protein
VVQNYMRYDPSRAQINILHCRATRLKVIFFSGNNLNTSFINRNKHETRILHEL